MNEELKELYQQVIIDHNKNPRNFRKIELPSHHSEGFNPLCGDHVYIYLDVANGVIRDISFEGNGCAISKSSASIMTAELKGKTLEEAEVLFQKFHELVTGKLTDEEEIEKLGKLSIFQGVRDFPVRVKCASLPWHTLHAALHDQQTAVSTE
ncbi:MAG: SUF system NifU family Fe-S cluster assembly protein [Ignavibacteriales bacterium]|nr:MAG: SUF system NifU family Fe-S cluster assembly protein [Ignavibacteriaceae bacterium]MBW7872093.1 SUF system NifU family Fe-S cluster assembly protein [Ignavibacteria bacterium]MCZ2143727.1 SUF system NifU family Fe-S cluster assembly protein [Ignavibacteriales bacterium]MBV6446011.1 Zinc-dependent sulfurtransferase SufU [Ignavibacteriaceae bacterium]MBZ0195762.1 SUF system NifU family Fe-S cluster assembly protein [Ignavibacteriaceae bacterium]